MCILFSLPREWARTRHGNTESKTHRGHISLRSTNVEADTTLTNSFSTWRVLNKSNSIEGRGAGERARLRREMDVRSLVSVPQAEVPEGSGEGSGGRTVGSARESHICAYRTAVGWLPPSWSAHLQADCPPGVMRVAEMMEGADRPWPGADVAGPVPGPVHAFFLAAHVNTGGRQACEKWQPGLPASALQVGPGAPSSSFGGRGQAQACTPHTSVRFLKAWTGDLFATCLPAEPMATGSPAGMAAGVWVTDHGREDRALLALWAS